MSFLEAHGDHKRIKLLPGKSRGGDSLKRFSSTCLPNIDVLHGLLPTKMIGKPRLDPTCLMSSGSLKFGKVMNQPYFEHSVSAGYPSGVDGPLYKAFRY